MTKTEYQTSITTNLTAAEALCADLRKLRGFGNPSFHNSRAVERDKAVLDIHLAAVLGKPICSLGDLRLCHVVALAVLRQRFVDHAGNMVVLGVGLLLYPVPGVKRLLGG